MKLIDSKLIENISCEDVTEKELQEVFDQSKEMYNLIKGTRNAIGLAAPQVGIFKNFFIFKTADSYTLCINPVYVKNGPKIRSNESCLSYGINNWKIVNRWKSISEPFRGRNGKHGQDINSLPASSKKVREHC